MRRALLMSDGDWMTFLESPISAGFLAFSALLCVLVATPAIKRNRKVAFAEDD